MIMFLSNSVVRVILGYAPQETEGIETRDEFFTELEIEVTKCKMVDELPIVVGDLNAKIHLQEGVIESTTANGKLLLNVVNNQELDVLNYHNKCEGKWTHVVRTTNSPSVLDYMLSCKQITNTVQQVIIDEQCLVCPFSVKKSKGRQTQQFSDHNAMILRLEMPHEKKVADKLPKSWKITDEGLQKLVHLTNQEFKCKSDGNTFQERYDNIEKGLVELMDECFQTRKRKNNEQAVPAEYYKIYKKITEFSRKGKAERLVARKYIEEINKVKIEKVAAAHKRKIQTVVENLTVGNTFSPNGFWNLCKKARKNASTGTSVETEDGSELFGDEMIRNAYMEEFKYRLRKREISDDLKTYETLTEQLCQLHLQNIEKKGPPYSKEELEKVRKHLKKGKSAGRDNLPPELYISGGPKLQNTILNMCNDAKENNSVPGQWTQVQISTMYKNKGKKKRLLNQRGIFLKQVLSKMYEKLNMNRAKDAMKSIDKCQAGGQEDRSTADQTYLFRAAIDHCKYMDQPLYVTLYDYSQCFDSLWLTDCLLSMIKIGVDKETVSILKKLNDTCNIKVKTPAGMTDEFEMNSIVQQGSVSGGALCVASTGEISQEDLGQGYQIGEAILKVLAFVDDIATLNKNHQETYQAHDRVKWFSDKKRLLLNALKCLLLCINTKNTDVIPKLMIGDTALKVVDKAPYLGDIFNKAGNNNDLIEDREKKGKACTINAMSLCAEITMGIYTIPTLLLLYRSVFIHVVLYNSQAWSNLTRKNINTIQVVQLNYLKRMHHAPRSTSNAITFLETGTIPIENEIHIKQLTFLHHILKLKDDDLVRKTYKQQINFSFEPNWANNIQQLRTKYGISETDDEIKLTSKSKWKNSVKRKVRKSAVTELKSKAAEQKNGKMLSYPGKVYTQEYLTKLPSTNARKIFHARSGVIDLRACRKYQYGEETSCRLCNKEPEDVPHVVNRCSKIKRSSIIDVHTTNTDELMEMSKRLICFDNEVDEVENSPTIDC